MSQRWFLLIVCAAAVMPVSRAVALQAEHEREGHQISAGHRAAEASGHTAHGEEGEKPPLLSFDPGSAIWAIIVFGVLLIVLRATAWKPILAGLQQRERFITDSIEGAKREREAADKLLRQYTEQIDKARVEATAIVEEGKRDAEAVRRRIHEEAKKEADDMIERAKREISVARDDAIRDLYQRTLDLASDVAGKIVRRQISAQDHRALLDEALTEMSKVEA